MNRFRGTGGKLGFYKTGVGKARILVGVTIAIFSWLMAYFIVGIPFLQTLYTLGAIPLMWAGLSLGWGSYMDQGTVARRGNEIFKPLKNVKVEVLHGLWDLVQEKRSCMNTL